jgi:dihydroceramidase
MFLSSVEAHNGRHLMTGVGAYLWLTWGIWLRHCLNGRQDEYTMTWPGLLSLPEIVRNPEANGENKRGN